MTLIDPLEEEALALKNAQAALAKGQQAVIYRRLVSDMDTPVSAFLKLAHQDPYACLLESVEGGETVGRYSIIGSAPDAFFKIDHGKAFAGSSLDDMDPQEETPLESLRTILAENQMTLPKDLPPMAAGWVGYLGYDLVREIERLAPAKPDPLDIPATLLIRPTLMAVFDTVTHSITLVTPVRPPGNSAVDASTIQSILTKARARLDKAMDMLYAPVPRQSLQAAVPVAAKSNTSEAEYLDMVARAKDYILAGDIFQVVLSQRFSQPFNLDPFSLYRALRRTNPSPFLYFLKFKDTAIVGSSPEILVRLRKNQVTIRPIAGTRPRGATREEDEAHEKSLLADQKELAEHLMLLDLGRNDVGRVSSDGSVTVTARNTIERYSHVMHIVSNVQGDLRPGMDIIDVLSAGFPAGTVSGAPKVRAMEIIDDLEKDGRSAYAGAVGYFSACGDMDTAIVLRTGIVKDGMLHVQAGAGIVADSDPASEQRECVAKASAVFHAAEEARKQAQTN